MSVPINLDRTLQPVVQSFRQIEELQKRIENAQTLEEARMWSRMLLAGPVAFLRGYTGTNK